MSSTKQGKRRRRRRLVIFLVLGGVGYAVRRAKGQQAGRSAGRADFGSPTPHGPRPPARATSATPRPAAEKLVEKPAAKPAEPPAQQPAPVKAEASEAPHGPDSHAALEDGAQPEGFPIKGNADSMLYHVPGSSFYNRTVAEVWFRSAEAAEAAGFQLPPSQREKKDPPAEQPVAETIPGTEALDSAPAKKAPAKKAVAAKKAPAKKTVAKKATPAAKKTPPPPAD